MEWNDSLEAQGEETFLACQEELLFGCFAEYFILVVVKWMLPFVPLLSETARGCYKVLVWGSDQILELRGPPR